MVKNSHVGLEAKKVAWSPSHRDDDVEVLRLSSLAGVVQRGVLERLEFHLVVIYDRGRTHHEVDFVSHPCTAGTVVYVAARQVHRFALSRGVDGYALLFNPEMFLPGRGRAVGLWQSSFFDDIGWPPRVTLARGDLRRALQSLTGLADLTRWRTPSRLRPALLQHATAATLLELAVRAGLSTTPLASQDDDAYRARAFRDATERSYRITRRIRDYSEALGCSERTLDRIARRSFGLSAKAYVDARVVLEARRMLAHTHASQASIAEHLGFSEATNFAKFFRIRTGEAPGDFRQHKGASGRPP